MELIRTIWMFFQDQVLGMKWLSALIGRGLSAVGLDMDSILGGGLQFFIYDTIKIFVLLSVLIFGISYIYSLFWEMGLIRVPEKVEKKLKNKKETSAATL